MGVLEIMLAIATLIMILLVIVIYIQQRIINKLDKTILKRNSVINLLNNDLLEEMQENMKYMETLQELKPKETKKKPGRPKKIDSNKK